MLILYDESWFNFLRWFRSADNHVNNRNFTIEIEISGVPRAEWLEVIFPSYPH